MKYVITGASGHISKPIVLQLLNEGHDVTVIGRSAGNLQELVSKGAKAATGSVEDIAFLTETFKGADAVYLMTPPNFGTASIKAFIASIGANYATALKASGVKNAVVLSSVGAHLANGVGPVDGLHRLEQELKKLEDVNILFLRPAYFYYNLFANLELIRHQQIIGSNFAAAQGKFPIVHTSDIADAAVDALLNLNFKGHTVKYVVSDEVGTDQIAAAIGKALGKPELPWVVFSDDQAFQGMVQAGLPEDISRNYVEMGNAINTGIMSEDYYKQNNRTLGKVKLEDFAKEFASVYNAPAQA
ncbi:MAG: NAD(P)H-binding protein [Chitinophagaceae bacterium]|nr:NAD(P)H-binding protein [Chitinophagaceae bacterium]